MDDYGQYELPAEREKMEEKDEKSEGVEGRGGRSGKYISSGRE